MQIITDRVQKPEKGDEVYDDWLLERKVRIRQRDSRDEGELGNSCCFGTKVVDISMDCVWKLHGGI